MQEQLITFPTSNLAKEKGFSIECENCTINHMIHGEIITKSSFVDKEIIIGYAPTQSFLQKWIRETRGVHIEIHKNASGWYWAMCKTEGGTDLGWSDEPVNDSYEDALEFAMQVQLSYDIPKDLKIIKHWGNYVDYAIKEYFKNKNATFTISTKDV